MDETMSNERPVSRGEFETVVSAVRHTINSGESESRIPFADTELALERTDEGAYTLHSPGYAAPMSLFSDPTVMPRTYPPQLPFVAEEFVTTGDSEGHLFAMWWAPRDSEQLLQQLHEQSILSGWTLENEVLMPERSVAQRSYAKDNLRRLILMSDGPITMTDRENPLSSAEGVHCRR